MSDLYLDEDVSAHLLGFLVALGHDVTSAGTLGNQGLKDPDQLLITTNLNRTLITYNADDFELLHDAWRAWSTAWHVTPLPQHPGILIVHSSNRPTPHQLRSTCARQARFR